MPTEENHQTKPARQRSRTRERGRNNALPGFVINKEKSNEVEPRHVPIKYWSPDQVFDKQSHRGYMTMKTSENPNYDGSDDSCEDAEPKRWMRNPLNARKNKRSDRSSKGNLEGNKESVNISHPVSDSSIGRGQKTVVANGGNTRGKFDRLEDRRRRRMNTSLTSEDEGIDVQMSISKLRQNALRTLSKENVNKSDSLHAQAYQPAIYSQTFENVQKRNSHPNQTLSLRADSQVSSQDVNWNTVAGSGDMYSTTSLPKENTISFSRSSVNGGMLPTKDTRHSFNASLMTQSVVTPRKTEYTQQIENDRANNRKGMIFNNNVPVRLSDDRLSYSVSQNRDKQRDDDLPKAIESADLLQIRVALPDSQSAFLISPPNQSSMPQKFPVHDSANENVISTSNMKPSLIKTVIKPAQINSKTTIYHRNQTVAQPQSQSSNSTPAVARKPQRKIAGNALEADSLDELLESNKDYLYTLQRTKQNSAINPVKETPQIKKVTDADQTTVCDAVDQESFTSVQTVIDKLQRQVNSDIKISASVGSPDWRTSTNRKASIGLMSDTSEMRTKVHSNLVKVDSMDDLWIPRRIGDERNHVESESNTLHDKQNLNNSRVLSNVTPKFSTTVEGCVIDKINLGRKEENFARNASSDVIKDCMPRKSAGFDGGSNLNFENYKINSDASRVAGTGDNEDDIEEEVSERVKKWEDRMKGKNERKERPIVSDTSAKVVETRINQRIQHQPLIVSSSQQPVSQPKFTVSQSQFTTSQQPFSTCQAQYEVWGQWHVGAGKPALGSNWSMANPQESGSRRQKEEYNVWNIPRLYDAAEQSRKIPEQKMENSEIKRSLIERKFTLEDEPTVSKFSYNTNVKDYTKDANNNNNRFLNVDQSVEKIEVSRDTFVHKKKPMPRSNISNSKPSSIGTAKDLYVPGRNISSLAQNLSQSVYTFPTLSNPFNTHKKSEIGLKNNMQTSHFSEPGTLKTQLWTPLTQLSSTSLSSDRIYHRLNSDDYLSRDVKDTSADDPIWKEIEKMTSYASTVAASTSQLNTTPKSFSSTPRKNNITPQDRDYLIPTASKSQDAFTKNAAVSYQQPKPSSNYSYPMKMDFRQANQKLNSAGFASLYNRPEALDDVLNEIASEQKRRPFSPKVKTPKTGTCSNSSVFSAGSPDQRLLSPVTTNKPPRIVSQYDPPLPLITQDNLRLSSGYDNVHSDYAKGSDIRDQPRQIHSDNRFINMAPHGHEYQLDLSLLKQKLLATGLVESTDDNTDGEAQKSSTLHTKDAEQMNQAIVELKELAREVETKVSQIKKKIVCSEENNNLDDILSTLKQCSTNNAQHGFTRTRKAKLNDALTELENVFKGLALSGESCSGNEAWMSGPTQDNTAQYDANNQVPFLVAETGAPLQVHDRNQQTSNQTITNALNDVEFDLLTESLRRSTHHGGALEGLEKTELSQQTEPSQRSPRHSASSNTSVADPVLDDLATRRFQRTEKLKLFQSSVMSPTYLSMSPVFSPTTISDNTRKSQSVNPIDSREKVKSTDSVVDDIYRRFNDINRVDKTSPQVFSPKTAGYFSYKKEQAVQPNKSFNEWIENLSHYKGMTSNSNMISKPPVKAQEQRDMKSVETQTSSMNSLRENKDFMGENDSRSKRSYARIEKKKVDRRNRKSFGYVVGKVERLSSSEDDQGLSNSAPDLVNLDFYGSGGTLSSRQNSDTLSASCHATPLLKPRRQRQLKYAASRSARVISASSDDSQDKKEQCEICTDYCDMPTKRENVAIADSEMQGKRSYVVVLRNKYTAEEKLERTERSKSFPELLATFEKDIKRNRRLTMHSFASRDYRNMEKIEENFFSEPNIHDCVPDLSGLQTKDDILRHFGLLPKQED